MRTTTLLKKLLGIQHLVVDDFRLDGLALMVDVHPTWRRPRCPICHRIVPGYDRLPVRLWRHLDFAGTQVLLRYARRRVACPVCGIHVEEVPWSDGAESRFTHAFEESVAFLAQCTDKTSVLEVFRISWVTVGKIIERVVGRHRPEDPLDGLTAIGVDELSYRKGHQYVTLVTDHATGRIVWGKKGKNTETFMSFFKALGEERCKAIRVVTMDMSGAYQKAVREKVPQAQIVFDRFHVQKLVSEALTETRREQWRTLKAQEPEQAKKIKGLHWALQKRPWNLTPKQRNRLSTLQRDNAPVYRAYLLKESFAAILDRLQPNVVASKLRDWLTWASHSRLPEFVQVARTIRKHFDDIIAYVRWRLSNGVVEGLNNKIRVIARRAYGFHSASALIAMVMLSCSGILLTRLLGPLK
jgi:transposase